MTDEHATPDSSGAPHKEPERPRRPAKKTPATPLSTTNATGKDAQSSERRPASAEPPTAKPRRSRAKKTSTGKEIAAQDNATAESAPIEGPSLLAEAARTGTEKKSSARRSGARSGGKSPSEASPAMLAETPLLSPAPETASAAVSLPPATQESRSSATEQDPTAPEQPRKSRRGRRGGRGRRKRTAVEGAPLSIAAPMADDDATEDTPAAPLKAPRKAAAFPSSEDASAKLGRRKMFISVVPGEQVEVALAEEGAIHEYYLEMLRQAKVKGNIYKGIINNIDTNLQAAFVNYGAAKNGFLQIDEIHSEYYLAHHEPAKGKKFPPIQKVVKPGQEVLVQVVKEPTGNKGAFLTTWLSLAGRFLVLTPGQEQIGVSRKVENDEERSRLRELMNGIEPGEGLGAIVRTVSAGTSKTTLKNDLQYLKRVWKEIRKRGTSEAAPFLVYQEPGLAERAVRDYLTDDVCEVWVDNAQEAESLRETVSLLFPRKKDLVRVHADPRHTLWERFNIQRQLEQIYSREVTLPSGGRLAFDQTEALMAVDINSGKISGKGNFEAMALKTNLEAAEAIARHLKLRDIGGQVVIDFIEMRDKNHVREVEKTLRNAMKNDRARHDIGRISAFGLLEIVRQRTGSSALAITMESCPACGGTGLRRNMEWQALQALREIGRQARGCVNGKSVFETTAELGMYLLNHKRDRLREMELELNLPIEIRVRP